MKPDPSYIKAINKIIIETILQIENKKKLSQIISFLVESNPTLGGLVFESYQHKKKSNDKTIQLIVNEIIANEFANKWYGRYKKAKKILKLSR